MIEVLLLAVGLALDATAVTASLAASRQPGRVLAWAVAVFGVFQAGMAGLGAVFGVQLAAWASGWDHAIAATLLIGVGIWMLARAERADADGDEVALDGPIPAGVLIGLALATSIDALTAGVGLPHIGVDLFTAVGVIGAVTAGSCGLGAVAGASLSAAGGRWPARIAAIVLVGLGVRVLLV